MPSGMGLLGEKLHSIRAKIRLQNKIALVLTCAVVALMALPRAAPAEGISPDLLQNLARQFKNKVGSSLEAADQALNPNSAADKKRKQSYDALADGELLLLSTTLREARNPALSKYSVLEPISAIKMGDDAYLSLIDFAYIAGFAIKVDAEKGIADGWYIKEDRPFLLDVNKNTVLLGDIAQTFTPSEVIAEGEDFYIKSSTIENWFNLVTDIAPGAQTLSIITNESWPLQARLQRENRRRNVYVRRPPEKPRMVQEFKPITLPRADIALNQQYEKRGDNSEPYNFSQYSAILSNQLMDHEMTSFVSGTLASNRDSSPVEQVRINFKKESENNDLLGPLEAKVYELNDLSPTYVTNTGSAANERGVRISNQSSRYTTATDTIIDGDSQPGWDVELYRNGGFISGMTVDETGHYSFERVSLFAGDNRFRLVFFGPEGQQREEERIVTVLPNLVGDIKGYYNASLTQKDTITYRSNPFDSEDTGTLRFAGVYDRRVSDNLTLRGGLHTRETNGQRDNYFYSGAVSSLGEAILNADLVTTSAGPYRGTLTARQRFGLHNAAAGVDLTSTGFSETFIAEDSTVPPQTESVYARLNGPFLRNIYSNVTYDAGQRFSRDENGRFTTLSDFGINSNYKGLNFDNELSYATDNMDMNGRDQELTYIGGVRGNTRNYLWRGRMEYEIMPSAEPIAFALSVNKSFDSRLSGYVDLTHSVLADLSTGTVGLSYYGDKARVSPQISYDSDSNMQAKVNVNFSLAKDVYNDDIVMSGMPLGSKAGLSVFSFLDKQGDGVFSEGDEPLPDVVINVVQHNIQLVTDEDGTAFNASIPTNRPSDVVMEENSAFEPNWVPGFDGASFLARPSESIRVEFPVLRGAEIDGTVYIAREVGEPDAGRSMSVSLITPEGTVAKTSATPFDGFYVMQAIRPGVYYLTTSSRQSPTTAYRTPEKIVITPEGAQIYGKNLMLTRGYDIPFTFSASNANPALERRTKILKPEDIAREDVYIRLGNYRSALAASLAWYKLKLQTRGWNNQLSPMAKDFDAITRDEKTGRLPLLLRTAQPLRIEEAALLCERLVDAGFADCGVDVVTTYQDGTNAAAATPAPTKG